jgi:hypothetical protein
VNRPTQVNYFCNRCDEGVSEVTLGRCAPCIRLLDGICAGTEVRYRHGKGWGIGVVKRVTQARRGRSFEITTSQGGTIMRTDVYLPHEVPR